MNILKKFQVGLFHWNIEHNNYFVYYIFNKSLPYYQEGASIGSTGIVTTDSTSFTVVGNIFMGSSFGNGQIVPGTGVHLNSVLQLFSEIKLNKFAPGRRPLIPLGPVYLSATHRKCGIRAGIVSFDGLWGLTDAAQYPFPSITS
ncbi:Glutathione hydrolase 7 [Schistosoma haematobium]|uniref:Glutathione hydrolase 7 n=1 Tax=Schistosoma haematobium TaxID=6185 RepID=A0A922LFD9_SCHHA|nr:Glutathione hydrolase 7 [Schistosoma haematobium]KAH9582405.1 Glutathione hydrolase 7 [Schistosoma haematobium]